MKMFSEMYPSRKKDNKGANNESKTGNSIYAEILKGAVCDYVGLYADALCVLCAEYV